MHTPLKMWQRNAENGVDSHTGESVRGEYDDLALYRFSSADNLDKF